MEIIDKRKYSLSIIVPVYNAESTIKDCLESILSQTYENYELILVDDGSTDNSSVLCNEYAAKDDRISVIHIDNAGTFQARKLGAEKAKGEILVFSDADDWFEHNAFEAGIQVFFEYNPDIFAYAYVTDDGTSEKNLYNEKRYCRAEISNDIIPGMMYDSTIGGRRLNPSLCCKFIKKKLYMQVTESVEDRITLGEDALVTYPAVCMADSIFICNKALYHYRNNNFSCTHTFPLERILEVKAFQNNMVRLFDKMGMLDKVECQIESYTRLFLEMMVKSWYGLELSPIIFSFPFKNIVKDSDVFIYGAGDVGKSYINGLKITNYANIVGWADKNYEKCRTYNNVNIIAPELIKERLFDILLIAVWDEKVANDIKSKLIGMGIPENKVLWIKPIRLI